MQVSRHQLIEAIMGAAHDVGLEKIPAEDYCALLRVGYRAAAVGSNYSDGPGCPAVQAGLATADGANHTARANSTEPPWLDQWIVRYDERIHANDPIVGEFWRVVEVTD